MPRYTFALQDGTAPVDDESGVWLGSREQAREHAEGVAQELMRGREVQTRPWRLDVFEDGQVIYEISFASVDPTLDHLAPSLRTRVEASSVTIRSTREIIEAARATVREARALVAKSRGKPYLAAERGEPTIRNEPAQAAGRELTEGRGHQGRLRRIK